LTNQKSATQEEFSPVTLHRPDRRADRTGLWSILSIATCLAYGAVLMVNAQTASEGSFYLYAGLLNHHLKLYHDLHALAAPFFYMENAAWIKLFGPSWVAYTAYWLLHLLILTAGLFAIVRLAPISDVTRAFLLATSFFIATGYWFYRFDDYRVTTDSCGIFIALLLYRFITTRNGRLANAAIGAASGVLVAVAIMTRINDGLSMLIATIVIVSVSRQNGKLSFFTTFLIGLSSAYAAIFFSEGDTIEEFLQYVFFTSTGTKGGLASVLLSPLKFFWQIMIALSQAEFLLGASICGFVIVSVVLFEKMIRDRTVEKQRPLIYLCAGIVAITDIWILVYYPGGFFLGALAPVFMLVLVASGVWVLARSVWRGWLAQSAPLLLLPCAGLGSLAMSSGGQFHGNYGPLGLALALSPVVVDLTKVAVGVKRVDGTAVALAACSSMVGRSLAPVSWQYYISEPAFFHRELYYSDQRGWWIGDQTLDKFFGQVCDLVAMSGKRQIFSTPFSFVNYYCGLPLWNNIVQSWYDTTSEETVTKIDKELEMKPPSWILYERQLRYVIQDQRVFNNNRKLAYWKIDNLIKRKVESGEWTVVTRKRWFRGDDWFLIWTAPNYPAPKDVPWWSETWRQEPHTMGSPDD
jgi:hypothetical protein